MSEFIGAKGSVPLVIRRRRMADCICTGICVISVMVGALVIFWAWFQK